MLLVIVLFLFLAVILYDWFSMLKKEGKKKGLFTFLQLQSALLY